MPILLGIVPYVLLQVGRHSYYRGSVCQSCQALYSMVLCRLGFTATTEAPCVNPARIVQNVLLQAGRHNYYRGTACQSCWALYSMFCSCRLAGPATTETLRANPAGHCTVCFAAGWPAQLLRRHCVPILPGILPKICSEPGPHPLLMQGSAGLPTGLQV